MFAEILYTSASHSFYLPASFFTHSFYQLASFNEKKKETRLGCVIHSWSCTVFLEPYALRQIFICLVAMLLWRYTNDTTDLRGAILINMQALSGCSDLWLMKMTALFNKYSPKKSMCASRLPPFFTAALPLETTLHLTQVLQLPIEANREK